ncbi:hypothetical protein R5R35_008094 [Gryllus longicercus]|uniref:THAP-type domain-containing protein n=1 Tax=Gryllus longicercus TaxID=2509291 RepID=A0AAN9VCK2_9ORTH
MPGCTVPRCSNSTQKGFKLFHFPSDSERCALWVKNCGREEGWEPTRHTCICEVHFEESQFELHRADGLRKLKPYAVPTLFNDATPTFYSTRKKSNNENDNTNLKPGLQKDTKQRKNDKKNITMSMDVSPRISKSTNLKPGLQKTSSQRKNDENISMSPDVLPSVSNVREASQSRSEANACFICNSRNQNIVPDNAYTETSKIQLKQKLVQLVAVEFDLLVEDIGAVCINCAQILNCIDYIESIHNTLSKGILNHMKQKFCMEPTEHVNLELCMKSLKNLTVFYPWKDVDESRLIQKRKENVLVSSEAQHNYESDKSSEVTDQHSEIENEVHNVENQEIILHENRVENTTTANNFECEICSYETKYKAFMIFHLRQHFQRHYTCDFCSTPVAYDPSPAKEFQTSDPSCKIRKDSESKSGKTSKVSSPRFSKPQTDYQQQNRDSLEKRNMWITRKRKSANVQESDKCVKRTNISHKFEDDSPHLILNSKEKQKNLL